MLDELLYRKRLRAQRLREEVIVRLVELQDEGVMFQWPETMAENGNGSLPDTQAWPTQGLLRAHGYRVGQRGIDRGSRRGLLDAIYLNRVIQLPDAAYMSQWGKPGSGKRLRKLAHTIASFTRNARRANQEARSVAITDWEGDLAYLRRKFYEGQYDFAWPNPRLKKRT